MKTMSLKQYESILDEEFVLDGIKFAIVKYPSGWEVYDETNDYSIIWNLPNKKAAIAEVEKYTGKKYSEKIEHCFL